MRNLSGAHPFDGARVANILPGAADELGLDEQDGVVVLSVRAGSTAARLGFRTGDIIVQIGAREDRDRQRAGERCSRSASALWQVVVKRGNQMLQLQLPG